MFKILRQLHGIGLEKYQQEFEELLAIAKRKVEIAKIVDSFSVFNSLVLCLGLSQCIAAVKKVQESREQATQYSKEVGEWAQTMGPAAAVAFKMDQEEMYKRLFG